MDHDIFVLRDNIDRVICPIAVGISEGIDGKRRIAPGTVNSSSMELLNTFTVFNIEILAFSQFITPAARI